MLRDGVGHGGRQFFASESFQNLCLGEIGVVEDDGQNLWVAFGKEGAGDSAGAAAGERDLLAERELCETREELVLGDAFEFGRRAYGKCELSEVHQVEVFDEAQVGETRRVRMKRESALDAIILQQVFAIDDFFENFDREIFAIEQEAELGFVERRIVEEREQDVGGVMMDEGREIVAGGSKNLMFVWIGGGHATSLLTAGLLLAAVWDLRTMRLVRARDARRLRLEERAEGQLRRAARFF
jgi:hypothetical protein